jgi:hypothetical protein
MIEKEVGIRVIAYDVIRALVRETAKVHRIEVDRLGLKGTVNTLSPWTPAGAGAVCLVHRPPGAAARHPR